MPSSKTKQELLSDSYAALPYQPLFPVFIIGKHYITCFLLFRMILIKTFTPPRVPVKQYRKRNLKGMVKWLLGIRKPKDLTTFAQKWPCDS